MRDRVLAQKFTDLFLELPKAVREYYESLRSRQAQTHFINRSFKQTPAGKLVIDEAFMLREVMTRTKTEKASDDAEGLSMHDL